MTVVTATRLQARLALAASLAFPAMFAALLVWEASRCPGEAQRASADAVGLAVRCEDVDWTMPAWLEAAYFVSAVVHLPAMFVFVGSTVLPLVRSRAPKPRGFAIGLGILVAVELWAVPYSILAAVVLLDRAGDSVRLLW